MEISVFGAVFDVVAVGFVLLVLFVVILFIDNILSYRKYKLLREQFDYLKRHADEDKQAEMHEISLMSQKLAGVETQLKETTAMAETSFGLPQALEQKLKVLAEQEKRIESLEAQLDEKIRKSSSTDVSRLSKQEQNLSKRVSGMKSVSAELTRQKRLVAELKEDHAKLKREFHKHEVTPIHVTEGIDELTGTIDRAYTEILGTESKVNKLEKGLSGVKRSTARKSLLKETTESLARRIRRTAKRVTKTREFAEEETGKKVGKKTFRKTLRAVRNEIDEIAGRKKAKAKAPAAKPAPAQAEIPPRAY